MRNIREVLEAGAASSTRHDHAALLARAARVRRRNRALMAGVTTVSILIAVPVGTRLMQGDRAEPSSVGSLHTASSRDLVSGQTIALPGKPTSVRSDEVGSAILVGQGAERSIVLLNGQLSVEGEAEVPEGTADFALDNDAMYAVAVAPKTFEGTLVKLDRDSGNGLGTMAIPGRPSSIAVSAEAVWVATIEGKVFRASKDLSTIQLWNGGGSTVASNGAEIWTISTDGQVRRLAPTPDGDPLTFDVGPNLAGIAVSGQAVWVTQQTPKGGYALLWRAAGGERFASVDLPGLGSGPLTAVGKEAWISLWGESIRGGRGRVIGYDISRHELSEPAEVGASPHGLALTADGRLLVANFDDATASEIGGLPASDGD